MKQYWMCLYHKFKNNVELLYFIKNKDIYYTSKDFKNKRDIQIFNGLYLHENNEEEFLKLWKTIDFKEMFNDEEQFQEFQKIIISLSDDISSFHLLFKLFDYSNNNVFNDFTIKQIREKYLSIIRNNSQEILSNFEEIFIQDSILVIYLLDKKIKCAKSFIQNDLQKILPVKLINEIYLNLLSNFKDLSEEVIIEIIDFFTKKENLQCENLIYIIKNINVTRYKKLILINISKNLLIEKDMIFDYKERNEIKIFIEFQKMDLFSDKEYANSPYVQGMKGACNKILEYIINNYITFNELKKIIVIDLKSQLKKKIELLNIQKSLKDEEINEIVNNLITTKEKIKKQIELLELYLYVDRIFFNISKHQEILEIQKLLDKLKNGKIEELDKNKKKFDELKKSYPEDYLQDKVLLSTSKFFVDIFNHLRKKYQNNEGVQNIFEEALNEFKTLKYLFDKIPNPKIKE